MPGRLPSILIQSPTSNAVVGAQPFLVSGVVTAPRLPEPVAIDSVTVQVDEQPPVAATIKYIPNPKFIEATFTATVEVTGPGDPHTVTVTAVSDAGYAVHQAVSVDVGPRLAPPSVLMELVPMAGLDITPDSLQPLLGRISQQIASMPLVAQLQGAHKKLVGPNLVALTGPDPLLRIGLWIVDELFPVSELVQPSDNFGLPRFTDSVAASSFALAPLLHPPAPSTVPPAIFPVSGFAISIPTDTLQWVLNANFSNLAALAGSHFTLQSATIRTDSASNVTVTFSGTALGVGLTASITETLGTAARPGTNQLMPAVVADSVSAPASEWMLAMFVPAIGMIIFAALSNTGQSASQAKGVLNDVLNQLPARIPFRNSALPSKFQSEAPFPMAVLNFSSFTTSGDGIVGAGSIGLGTRDQSSVSMRLDGPGYYPNYTLGVETYYGLTLSEFEPDNDQVACTVSGGGAMETAAIDPFWQRGGFAAGFSIPFKAAPGRYDFTISASATETCATDPTKTLTGFASMPVTVNVVQGSQPRVGRAASEPGTLPSEKPETASFQGAPVPLGT